MRELNNYLISDILGSLSTRKRPCDIENILKEKVWSESKQDYIEMGHMSFDHILRKFVKENKNKLQKQKDLENAFISSVDDLETIEKQQKKIEVLENVCENFRDALTVKGHHMVFTEIPNTDYGRHLVKEMKKHLNKDSYTIRVKGQFLDEETKKKEGWRRYTYGQPLSKSKCLRVYIDKK